MNIDGIDKLLIGLVVGALCAVAVAVQALGLAVWVLGWQR